MTVSLDRVEQAVLELSLLRGFPRDPAVRGVIAKLLFKLCADDEHLDKLVARLIEGGDAWPGPATLRRTADDLRPRRGYEPTEAEKLIEQWKAEQAADLLECPAQCSAGMIRRNGPGSPWERCKCKWGARVTDQQIELENRMMLQRPGKSAGLQPLFNPAEFEQWQKIGEQKDRERALERVRFLRELKILDDADGGTLQ